MNTQEMFTENLNNDIPFVFAKFGDGELLCMSGARGTNCDGHNYSEALANKLKISLFGLSSTPNVYIADWNVERFENIRDTYINADKFNTANLVAYELLISTPYSLTDGLRELYKSILKCDERKQVMFIIPERLNGIKNYIAPNAEIVNVPLINGFTDYDRILSEILNKIQKDSIVITACGMMAKSLIWEIVEADPSTTCLDFGSAFDPLLVSKTRLGQADHTTVKTFFESIKI